MVSHWLADAPPAALLRVDCGVGYTDWWGGSRREQLRRWAELPLERVILAIEEMEELTERFRQMREPGKFSVKPAAGETPAVHQTPPRYDPD